MSRTLLAALLSGTLFLGASGAAPATAVPSAPAAVRSAAVDDPGRPADTWTAPLSTRGRYIVDASGNRFKLKSANWQGAQGSWNGSGDIGDPANHHDGEKSDQMPLGLDRTPIPTILADFHALGINSVRLPFSNEMLHDQRPVPDASVAANPALRGRTPLQVLDAVVAATTAEGFAVILNDHTNTSRFCCGLDGNERWNTSQSDTWDMLDLDHADAVQSLRTRARGDWDPGARKGVCPDGQRLVGLSHRDGRGLCTDSGAAPTVPAGARPSVVRDESQVQQGDWAVGYTKYQCGAGRFVSGYSVRGQAVSAVLCSPAERALGTSGRTVWFDRGDARPAGEPGGEFALGNFKGQCDTDEYMAGVAFTGAWAKGKTPDALLCRKLAQ
ncbi:cellulase family glycosylhydrolase [Streptomyces sp. NPDC057697]|uniref:cellulase family glycosylhydrolase n=1 Tax=Streptomyces sp. NPDC057697 TaxID=3346219 RepID=UPI00367BAE6E